MIENIKKNYDLNILLVALLMMFVIKGNEFMDIQYPKLSFIAIVFFLIPRIIHGSSNKIKFINENYLLLFKKIMITIGTMSLLLITILF